MTQTLKFFILKDGKTGTYKEDIKLFYNDLEVTIENYRHQKEQHQEVIETTANKKLDHIIIQYDMICQVSTNHVGQKDNFRLNAIYTYDNGEKTERHNLKPL